MSEYPSAPKGKVHITLEVDRRDIGESYVAAFARKQHTGSPIYYLGEEVVDVVDGGIFETPEEQKARLFREASDLIRKGTQRNSQVGSDDLRQGLIRIAEALEVK